MVELGDSLVHVDALGGDVLMQGGKWLLDFLFKLIEESYQRISSINADFKLSLWEMIIEDSKHDFVF